eukprot:Rmarinus@m.1121
MSEQHAKLFNECQVLLSKDLVLMSNMPFLKKRRIPIHSLFRMFSLRRAWAASPSVPLTSESTSLASGTFERSARAPKARSRTLLSITMRVSARGPGTPVVGMPWSLAFETTSPSPSSQTALLPWRAPRPKRSSLRWPETTRDCEAVRGHQKSG